MDRILREMNGNDWEPKEVGSGNEILERSSRCLLKN